MLDNTVAGGIVTGDSPFETIVRECAEEASFPPSLVVSTVRAAGIVTCTHRTSGGWLQPEFEYVYDMRLPTDGSVHPAPSDNEVESFKLLDLQDVVAKMLEGEFKPNCAHILLDWLIRCAPFLTIFFPLLLSEELSAGQTWPLDCRERLALPRALQPAPKVSRALKLYVLTGLYSTRTIRHRVMGHLTRFRMHIHLKYIIYFFSFVRMI
jgi:hypothetical protein